MTVAKNKQNTWKKHFKWPSTQAATTPCCSLVLGKGRGLHSLSGKLQISVCRICLILAPISSLTPHRLWRSECQAPWNKGTSIQKKQEGLPLQFYKEMKDQWKFEASSIPASFSSSFTTHSLKMQTHSATGLVPSVDDMTSNWQNCDCLTSKLITQRHFWATLKQ